MDRKCIIVKTYCDREDVMNRIIDCLLKKRLVAGSQVVEVNSKYWWNHTLCEKGEYQLSFRSTYDLFPLIKKEILESHNYEVPEISCTEILDASLEFLDWIRREVRGEESIGLDENKKYYF